MASYNEQQNEQIAYDFLTSQGLPAAGAAAIIGNLMQESSLNPEVVNGIGAAGIAQWYQGRVGNAVRTGNEQADLEAQLQNLVNEMKTSYPQSWQAAMTANAGNLNQVTEFIMQNYEDPGDNSGPTRSSYASQILSSYGGSNPNGKNNGFGGTTSTGYTGGAATSGPPASDSSYWIQYIQQNYPNDAFLLQPQYGLTQLLVNAAAAGDTQAQFNAAVENTAWFKSTSGNYQNYLSNLAQNPANYDFNTPGSLAQQTLAQVQNIAGTNGITLSGAQAQSLAQDALEYGWTASQIQQNIGSFVAISGTNYQAGEGTSNAPGATQWITSQAQGYAIPLSNSTLSAWTQGLVGGTMSQQQITGLLAQMATQQYPSLAQGLAQGQNVTTLLTPQITSFAQQLEVDPTTVEAGLINNSTYNKLLTGGMATQQSGQGNTKEGPGNLNIPAPMTTAEATKLATTQPQWQYTNNAHQTAANMAQALVTSFGMNPIG